MRRAIPSVEIVLEVRVEVEELLVVNAAKHLVVLHHELVSLLQLAAARHAAEAREVEDTLP